MYKSNYKYILIVSFTGILGLIIFVILNIKDKEKSKAIAEIKDAYYVKYSNINLSGIIVKKQSIDNGRYSLYTIKIKTSTVNDHDLRNQSESFLYIKGDTAKMVYAMSYYININDSINISYSSRLMTVYRNGNFVSEYDLPSFTDMYLSKKNNVSW